MFQILNCSDVGTCCQDYALANILDIARRIFDLIQIIAPIALIIAATIQLAKLVVNPDEKAGTKKILNKILAAAFIFFIPILFNMSLGVFPEDFSIYACWEQAKVIRELTQEQNSQYINLNDKKASTIIIDPKYQKGDPLPPSSGVTTQGGQRLVDIALKEIGNNEGDQSNAKYGAIFGWNYKTDWCAAFVSWCAIEAGFGNIIPKYGGCTGAYNSTLKPAGLVEHLEGSGYTPVAGDLIFFGNASTRTHTGIVISADDKYVYTVEGNTNCEGDAKSRCNGYDGVSKKTRVRPGNIYSYLTPQYPN